MKLKKAKINKRKRGKTYKDRRACLIMQWMKSKRNIETYWVIVKQD